MIYEYEGHTYTSHAMQQRLRAEYRDLGISVWKNAELAELIAYAPSYGLPEIKKIRKQRHKAERNIGVMIVPNDVQLLKLWELDLSLDHCTLVDNVLFAYYQMGPTLIRYAILADGTYTTRVFKMAQGYVKTPEKK